MSENGFTPYDLLILQEARASARLDGETITLTPPQGPPMEPQVHSQIMEVTPDLAREWLDHNDVNRNLRPARIYQYARAMTDGHWTITNDDICISTEGRLLNGQHRLNAVVRAGIPVKMGVKFNVPEKAMAHMDRGAARTTSDVLRLLGENDTALLAAVTRQVWLFENGLFETQNDVIPNDDELIDTLAAHPEIRDSLTAARKWRLDCPPTPLAFAHWLIGNVNGGDAANRYAEALSTRANEPLGSAVHAVNNRLAEARRARTRPATKEYVYLLVKGWNYWASGKTVSKLSLTPRGEGHIPTITEWSD